MLPLNLTSAQLAQRLVSAYDYVSQVHIQLAASVNREFSQGRLRDLQPTLYAVSALRKSYPQDKTLAQLEDNLTSLLGKL
jgi:hypothetical protein